MYIWLGLSFGFGFFWVVTLVDCVQYFSNSVDESSLFFLNLLVGIGYGSSEGVSI